MSKEVEVLEDAINKFKGKILATENSIVHYKKKLSSAEYTAEAARFELLRLQKELAIASGAKVELGFSVDEDGDFTYENDTQCIKISSNSCMNVVGIGGFKEGLQNDFELVKIDKRDDGTTLCQNEAVVVFLKESGHLLGKVNSFYGIAYLITPVKGESFCSIQTVKCWELFKMGTVYVVKKKENK